MAQHSVSASGLASEPRLTLMQEESQNIFTRLMDGAAETRSGWLMELGDVHAKSNGRQLTTMCEVVGVAHEDGRRVHGTTILNRSSCQHLRKFCPTRNADGAFVRMDYTEDQV